MARDLGPGCGAGARGRCSRRRCCSVRRAAVPARCPGTGARTPSAPGSRRASRCPGAYTAAGPVRPPSLPVRPLSQLGRAQVAPTADSRPQASGLPPPWRPGRARAPRGGAVGMPAAPRRCPDNRRARASVTRRRCLGMLRPLSPSRPCCTLSAWWTPAHTGVSLPELGYRKAGMYTLQGRSRPFPPSV